MPIIFEGTEENSIEDGWARDFYKSTMNIPGIGRKSSLKVASFNRSRQLTQLNRLHGKTYFGTQRIQLTSQSSETEPTLREVLKYRRSTRVYSEEQMSLQKLSNILETAYSETVSPFGFVRRSIPSPGGRFSIELYIVALNFSDLGKGLYHYDIKAKALEKLDSRDYKPELEDVFKANGITNPAVYIFATGIPERLSIKYDNLSWRVMLLEAGCLCQNIYLACEAEEVGCTALAHVSPSMQKLFGINENQEVILLGFTAGL